MRAARPARSTASAVGGMAEDLGSGRTGQDMDPSCGGRSRKRKGGGSRGAGLIRCLRFLRNIRGEGEPSAAIRSPTGKGKRRGAPLGTLSTSRAPFPPVSPLTYFPFLFLFKKTFQC